jgi:hypothetical protein
MGEAKRRKAAKAATARTETYRDITTGEAMEIRMAGDPLAYFDALRRHMARALMSDGDPDLAVPCGSCQECCYHGGVDVHPEREPPGRLAHLDLVERDGGLYLRKRADGACVHLGPEGCTVYEHRPNACRGYDCRMFALVNVLDKFDGDHAQPGWRFEPKTPESRAFLAACQMMGMVNYHELNKAGAGCSAPDVARAVFADREKLEKGASALMTLAKMPPDELTKMLGHDPRTTTPEQMHESLKMLTGGRGQTVVRERRGK